jgi:AGZA family xanthine/uracil permease-like MFS transporter
MQQSKLTTIKIELLGGLAIFFSLWTISFLYADMMKGFGFPFEQWFFNICLLMASGCILSAFILKQPFVIGPGLSIGWFAYDHILPQASQLNFFVCIILSGMMLILISFSKLIRQTQSLIPLYLQQTLSIGIGLLFLRISLVKQMGLEPHLSSISLYLFAILSLIYFRFRQNRFGVLLTVLLSFVLHCFMRGLPTPIFFQLPYGIHHLWDAPLGSLNTLKLCKQTIEMLLYSFFDGAIGVLCLQQIQSLMYLKVTPQNLTNTYRAVGFNNILSGLILGGPSTIYIESTIGLQVGARHSLSILFVALFFIIFMFCLPIGLMMPKELFHAILGFIGLSLLSPIYQLKHNQLIENMIVFILILVMVFTQSILNGLIAGIIMHFVLLLKAGDEIPKIQYITTLLAIFSLLLTVFHL